MAIGTKHEPQQYPSWSVSNMRGKRGKEKKGNKRSLLGFNPLLDCLDLMVHVTGTMIRDVSTGTAPRIADRQSMPSKRTTHKSMRSVRTAKSNKRNHSLGPSWTRSVACGLCFSFVSLRAGGPVPEPSRNAVAERVGRLLQDRLAANAARQQHPYTRISGTYPRDSVPLRCEMRAAGVHTRCRPAP